MKNSKIFDFTQDHEKKVNIFDKAKQFFEKKTKEYHSKNIIHYYVGRKNTREIFLEDTISWFEREYTSYINWVISENTKAHSLEQIINNMFSEPEDIFKTYAFQTITRFRKEQYNNKAISKRFFKLLYVNSVQSIKSNLDKLIERGIIPPSDSNVTATLFVQSTLLTCEIHVHKIMEHSVPKDLISMYSDYKLRTIKLLKEGA